MEKSQQESENEVTVARSNIMVETSKANEVFDDLEKQSTPSVHSQANTIALEDPENQPERPKTLREKISFGVLVVGIILAMFMMSLNTTVIAPALSIIATDLNGLDSQTWIATAYLVAVNAFQPLSGKVTKKKKS
jgi:hypothetical protein